jgi:hypothetical protein
MTHQQKTAREAYRQMLEIDAEARWRTAASECSSAALITAALIAGGLALCGIVGVLFS